MYNLTSPDGQKVKSVSVICTECQIPEYQPLDTEKTYRIITLNFLAEGGDNYDMIARHKKNHVIGKI